MYFRSRDTGVRVWLDQDLKMCFLLWSHNQKSLKPWLGSSVGQSVGYAKVVGSISHQGKYKNQPMNAIKKKKVWKAQGQEDV